MIFFFFFSPLSLKSTSRRHDPDYTKIEMAPAILPLSRWPRQKSSSLTDERKLARNIYKSRTNGENGWKWATKQDWQKKNKTKNTQNEVICTLQSTTRDLRDRYEQLYITIGHSHSDCVWKDQHMANSFIRGMLIWKDTSLRWYMRTGCVITGTYSWRAGGECLIVGLWISEEKFEQIHNTLCNLEVETLIAVLISAVSVHHSGKWHVCYVPTNLREHLEKI